MSGTVSIVMSLMPKEKINIIENKTAKKGTLFLTKNFPQLTKKLFTVSKLFSFPRYVGLGTKIRIAGIRKRLKKNETAIPKDTNNPISLTLESS